MVSEYIAGVLLKHSYENQWEYEKLAAAKKQSESRNNNKNHTATGTNTVQQTTQPATRPSAMTATTAAQNPSSTASATQSTAGETKAVTSSDEVLNSLKQVLGLNSGISLSYTQTVSGQRYPNEQYSVSVPANNSCVVVALEFELTNTTGSDITLNTTSSNAVIKLGIEGTTFTKSKRRPLRIRQRKNWNWASRVNGWVKKSWNSTMYLKASTGIVYSAISLINSSGEKKSVLSGKTEWANLRS